VRALVVDDSRPVRGIIAKIMRSLSFETIEVTNGKEALESLEKDGAFDVVTVNWQMPVMDGLEFVSAVRKSRKFHRLPLLMISSEADADRIAMAMKEGVNEYIVKPCTENSIAAKLSAMGLRTGAVIADTAPKPVAAPTTDSSKIRVLLVDDSSVVRRVITKTLGQFNDMDVVGGAKDGEEGLEMIATLKPDVVLLDVDMPRMDGLETLRQMRSQQIQVPVLMFSSRTERGAKIATDALLLGAKDFVFKPGGANMSDLKAGQQAIEYQIVPRLRSLTHRHGWLKTWHVPTGSAPATVRIDLVVIAASTGGPAALAKLVSDTQLRSSLHAPIMIAQHMPELFTKHLAGRLAQDSGLNVAEATDDEVLKPGMIRIAPGGRHVAICRTLAGFVTEVHDEPPVNSCRPSADVLFRSAASAAKQHLLAVVLTGMGQDGKEGCRSVRDTGGRVIVQDEATSVVWGMPGSVATEGLADSVIPLEKMGGQIARHLRVCRGGEVV
jgi:two-component system chemotaxis response regulator CheB